MLPFQISDSPGGPVGGLYTDPTATQLLADVQDTELKYACTTSGFCVGTIVQLVPAVTVPAQQISRGQCHGQDR